MKRIIIICGPTCVGKTAVGIELARRLGGEIVSADSQQVWRGFDVGTAKPTIAQRALVPHHLIDIADPTEHFDAARFVEMADRAIADIASRGRVPLIVGGTGMYLRMLVHGLCDTPPRDVEFRLEMQREIDNVSLSKLYERLQSIDPESAARIKQNDSTRIVRALEIYHMTGVAASELRQSHAFKGKRYDAKWIGLDLERPQLYARINARVDAMVANGLPGEVRVLREKYSDAVQPFSAVGYKEMSAHLRGEIDLAEAIRLIKQNTRRFAKRQLTWFRAETEIRWMPSEKITAIAETIAV